ncbi:MAG: hypothetical protein GX591_08905 [Planctomycetes bacterium]|nr:hypothetical protein [Planctomycetota bacterium]
MGAFSLSRGIQPRQLPIPCLEPLESRQLLSCDLVGSVNAAALPSPVVPGETVTLPITVTNQGDAPALGRMSVHCYLSLHADGSDPLGPMVLPSQAVKLAPGRGRTYAFRVVVPSTVPAGSYHLVTRIDPAGAIAGDDPTNNVDVTPQAVPLAYRFGAVPGRVRPVMLKLTDDDGSLVTFSLAGPGWAELTPAGGTYALTTTDTDARSSLKIAVRNGDGRFTLGDATIGSLKSLTAAAVDLEGDLTVTGGISAITLGNGVAGSSISIHGDAVPLTFKASDVSSMSLETAGAVRSINVASWTRSGLIGSRIVAQSLASFVSRGQAAFDLSLGSAGLSLGRLSAAGGIGPGDWLLAGSAGRITAGTIDAGWAASLRGAVTSLTVSGDAGGSVSAQQLGSVLIKGDLAGARMLAGTYLGEDLALGGEGAAADTYAAGSIRKFTVAGAVSDSWVFAGVDPFDGTLNDINDVQLGGASSFIGSISVGSLDAASSFNAARLPQTAVIARSRVAAHDDPRFAQNAFALTDAGMTGEAGLVTLDIAGQEQTFAILDEATGSPLAGAGVAVAVDAQSRSFGVMTIVSPGRNVPVRFVVLKGSAALSPMPVAAALAETGQEPQEPAVILTTDTATKAVQDVFTDKLVEQVFYDVAPAQQSLISSTVGALASAFTSLVTIGVHALDNVSHGAVSQYLASLPMATSRVLTPEQAKQQVIDSRAGDLASTMVLATMKGKLDPMAPYGVAFDLGSDFVQWSVANMAGDLPNMGVRVTSILGMDIYSYTPIPPWQQAAENGLVNVQVPTAADAENGFLELISKGDMGDGIIVPLDTGGNAQIPVPLGDYIGIVHAAGFEPARLPVTVTAGGANLDVTLQAPPEAGVVLQPQEGLETGENGAKAQFTVALSRRPTANVTVRLSSSDITEGRPKVNSLTFTPANWNQPQTVTVVGVNDSIADGNQPYQILVGPAASSDPLYNGAEGAAVSLVNIDNEEPREPSVTITSAIPVRVSQWNDYDITVTGTASGPVGTYFRFYSGLPRGFVMHSWTGVDAHGRPCRAAGDPPSTTYSFIDETSVTGVPMWTWVAVNLYPPGSLGEFVQAIYDVYLS